MVAQRVADQKTPLLALEVLDSPEERNAVIAFLVAGALGTAVSFLIPLYIQFVQGSHPPLHSRCHRPLRAGGCGSRHSLGSAV